MKFFGKIIILMISVVVFSCKKGEDNSFSIITRQLETNEVVQYNQKEKIKHLNDTTELHKLPVLVDSLYNDYFLVLYINGKIRSSIRIDGNWLDTDESVYNKNFRFLDENIYSNMSSKNLKIFSIKDRYHNGNICNGVVERFFSYNNQLKYLGYIETIQHLPVTNDFILRKIDDNYSFIEVIRSKTVNYSDKTEFLYRLELNLNNDTLLIDKNGEKSIVQFKSSCVKY